MWKQCLNLFFIFFRVGAFTFGGGYAMIPIIQKEIVERGKLIEEREFLDIIAVAQSLPGPIAVNASVFVGFKTMGMIGSIAALLGTILPSFTTIILLAIFYHRVKDITAIQLFFRGVRPAIVALIFMSAVRLSRAISKTMFNIIIMVLAFTAIALLDIHAIFVIIICAMAGFIHHRKEGKKNDLH